MWRLDSNRHILATTERRSSVRHFCAAYPPMTERAGFLPLHLFPSNSPASPGILLSGGNRPPTLNTDAYRRIRMAHRRAPPRADRERSVRERRPGPHEAVGAWLRRGYSRPTAVLNPGRAILGEGTGQTAKMPFRRQPRRQPQSSRWAGRTKQFERLSGEASRELLDNPW